jgi:hypothetical protein
MNNGIQHKMLTYEVTPPPGIWKKIAAGLDDSEIDHVFPDTLYSAEVIPPATAWNKIRMALNAGEEKAQPQLKSRLPFIRYAATAVLIGLVAWGGINLLNKKSGEREIAENKTTVPAPKEDNISTPHLPAGQAGITPEQVITNITASKTISDPDEARIDAALVASKKTVAKLDISPNNSRLKNIAAAYRFALSGETDVYPEATSRSEACSSDNTDRYIMIMKQEGNIVRISKTLSHLVCCVSAENEDTNCKIQMGKWRNKVASSTIGQNTGSFLELFSFINSLQEQ